MKFKIDYYYESEREATVEAESADEALRKFHDGDVIDDMEMCGVSISDEVVTKVEDTK